MFVVMMLGFYFLFATRRDQFPGGFVFLLWTSTCFPSVILEQDEDIPHNEVKNWALKFGVDLWEYGRQLTRMNELQRKYHEVDIDVVRKDGLILIREMAAEIKNMMDFKMSAVMRIMDIAEQAALAPQTDNAQNVKYYDARRLNIFDPNGKLVRRSREMLLTTNPHFDYLPVNTTFTSVLTPNFIDDNDPDVLNAIQWSEHLDPIFINNYESDPTLSWQYFGSSTGFLRRYPAIAWPPEEMSFVSWGSTEPRSVYDFRRSTWYVSAATSPKDMMILIDVSNTMSSEKLHIAIETTRAILDTLSNNDFVNVLKIGATTEETIHCFKDVLAQANNDNKRWLKDSVKALKTDSVANFTSAFIKAFEILQKYNRTGQGCQCNQLIMLITSGPFSSNHKIIQKYNWPHKPVRIFTYLVGSDSNSVNELHKIACDNKGYYTRVSKASEADEKILHYTKVLSRPMVMYQNDHPIQWTPVFLGRKVYAESFSSNNNNNPGQLMTSVTTPVFDRRNHSVRAANVLGVVGTDVSIEEIKKLIPPYKLGVNGYSYIVNNNGHVLYHPNLRPVYSNKEYEETLQPTYISVDLSELELIENENGPRENHSVLLDLRHDMIDQKEGETEMNVKIQYDNMKRVTTRRHKYFYNPIEGTPFSLGLALPEGYGMYELVAEQEIKHSQKNVEDYFKGNNWRVHPDWVYCEYTSRSLEEQSFRSAEERVLHFLSRSRRPGWKWMSLRPRSPLQHHPINKQDKDAYYCDKTLLQSLVLDAMVTEELDRHSSRPSHAEDNHQGFQMFGLTLSFVATRSGLLRWTDHDSKPAETANHQPHFSQTNVKAIDEVWYKRAVDQHAIEPESFVFSVPFDIGSSGKPLIMATHAVFVEHKGHRAPAAVVGLVYQHSVLASHFINITSACTGSAACKKTCFSDELDCYILDNNGFIIMSENPENTGKFFGQVDGTIMDSLVQDKIFNKVVLYDYQGSCINKRNYYSKAASKFWYSSKYVLRLLTHLVLVWISLFDYVFGMTRSYVRETDAAYDYETSYKNYNIDTEVIDEQDFVMPHYTTYTNNPLYISDSGIDTTTVDDIDISEMGIRPCDRKIDLYVLQPDKLNASGQNNPLKGKLTNCHVTGCERPFSVQKVPHSNLILLVVDTLCPCGSKQLSINPQEITYDNNANGGCLHKPKDSLYRRRPPKCINYHPEEIEIPVCGSASSNEVNNIVAFLVFILLVLFVQLS
ncbi:VWA N-terminal [Popillia japonica]|uniref:VWA N-terminal n=1 Tax=Popillia japonica TaxID=7064 RepID=A0AAW1NI80_POPJA